MKTELGIGNFLNHYTEDEFVMSFLTNNEAKLNHLLCHNGIYLEMNKTDFLLFINDYYDESVCYTKKHSLKIRPSEVVHVFRSKKKSEDLNLILKIKDLKIKKIVLETNTITIEEFELMQFYN